MLSPSILKNLSPEQVHELRKDLPPKEHLKEYINLNKDREYYKMEDVHAWNRSNKSDQKAYNELYFHHDEDTNNQFLGKVLTNLQNAQDHKEDQEFQKRMQQNENRRNLLLERQKKEILRKSIQYASQQKFDYKDNDKELLEHVSSDPKLFELATNRRSYRLNILNKNDWNNLAEKNEKYINQLIPPKIVEYEEKAKEQITSRFLQEEKMNLIQQILTQNSHDLTRSNFLKSHYKNINLQSSLGLTSSSIANPQNMNVTVNDFTKSQKLGNSSQFGSSIKFSKHKDTPYNNVTKDYFFPLKYTKSSGKPQLDMTMNSRLYQTRENMHQNDDHYQIDYAKTNHSDYYGLYMNEIDKRKLQSQSQIPLVRKFNKQIKLDQSQKFNSTPKNFTLSRKNTEFQNFSIPTPLNKNQSKKQAQFILKNLIQDNINKKQVEEIDNIKKGKIQFNGFPGKIFTSLFQE